MAELRHDVRDADLQQRPVQRDLARRRGQQVLAAQHVRDAHERVVDGVHERVERLPVRAHERVVRDRARLERDLPAHHVGEGDVLVRHPQAQHRLTALGAEGGLLLVREGAVEVVVTLRLEPRGGVARVGLLRGRERLVDVPALDEPRDDVLVDVRALRLPVRLVRAADLDALVPVEPEPAQRVEELLVALLAVARRVGVLDAEHERAAGVPRVGPVEQRGADEPDVRRPGRGRAEADADGRGTRCGDHGSQPSCPTPPGTRASGVGPVLVSVRDGLRRASRATGPPRPRRHDRRPEGGARERAPGTRMIARTTAYASTSPGALSRGDREDREHEDDHARDDGTPARPPRDGAAGPRPTISRAGRPGCSGRPAPRPRTRRGRRRRSARRRRACR